MPADATVWFGAYTSAPSDEGPLVGGRAGHGGLHIAGLMDLLHAGKSVRTKLRMTQMGVPGDGAFSKFTLEIVGFRGDPPPLPRVAKVSPLDMVDSQMYRHDKLLSDYVNLSLSPFSKEATRNGDLIAPSYAGIDAIHAPFWNDNIELPCFAFFTPNAVVTYDEDMLTFFERASQSILRRHVWWEGADHFVATCKAQFASAENTCSPLFKLACATVVSMCCLLSTSGFYRFDNAYVGKSRDEAVGIESFQDPMRCGGGDCEDLAGLNHRVFRWLSNGDPKYKDSSKYWCKRGGWPVDSVLDCMQRITHWYVSYGVLGSVTSAHVDKDAHVSSKPPTDLVIGSAQDRTCAFGGHMWMEAANVIEFEELVRRANGSPVNVRPSYDQAYPAWVRDMPHLLGEGTGALFPLPLPLGHYSLDLLSMHKEHNAALRSLRDNTQIIARLQVERMCDHLQEKTDTRMSTFYRQSTEVFTDDLLLQGIPFHTFASVLTDGVRHKDRTPARRGIGGIPGELTYSQDNMPKIGVDARDRFKALTKEHENVALMPYPPLTQPMAESFKRRVEHTLPFRQPWIQVSNTDQKQQRLKERVQEFVQRAREHLPPCKKATQKTFTIVDIAVRDNFLNTKIAETYLQDVICCAQDKRLVGIDATLDTFDQWHYGVRIELAVAMH